MHNILKYMKSLNISLSNSNNKEHFDLIIKQKRTHGNPLVEAEYQALKCLWNDQTIKDIYNKMTENCAKNSTK